MKTEEFYLIQDEIPQEDQPLYENEDLVGKIPKTVIFPNINLLKKFSRETILSNRVPYGFGEYSGKPYSFAADSEQYNWGYYDKSGCLIRTESPYTVEVPPEITRSLGLREGDKLRTYYDNREGLVVISGINGFTDMQAIYSWPNFDDPNLDADYPTRLLLIQAFGLFNLRVLTLLAPIGYGQNLYLIAPGRVGKTTILCDFFEASLRITKVNPKAVVILCFIGERRKDISEYKKRLKNTCHDAKRVEVFSAPIGVVPFKNQYETFLFALRRARRLAARYDVIVIIDSLFRAASAHSYGGFADKDGGMIPGGIHTESLLTVASEISNTGDLSRYSDEFGYGSLTIASAVLAGKGSVGQFATETQENVPDATWELFPSQTIGWPKVDLGELSTMTRKLEYLSETMPGLGEEIEEVHLKMWNKVERGRKPTNGADIAHLKLLEYARENLFPEWINGHVR